MKKYLIAILLFTACAFQIGCAAFAADLSPYQYNPKQPPVEVDLSVLDDVVMNPKPSPAAAAAIPRENAPFQEEAPAKIAPADHTAEFLDKIMAYHVPSGTKKKTLKAAPAPAVIEAPQAEKPDEAEKAAAVPAEVNPAADIVPAAIETPQAEKPAEAEKAAEAPAEETPSGPTVRERRHKTPDAAVQMQSDVTIAFDKNSSELSPAAAKDLDTLAMQLKDMPNQRLQIRAYATDADGNESNARRISLSRGLMVRSYLVEKGIKPVDLDVRALGSDSDQAPSDEVEVVFVK